MITLFSKSHTAENRHLDNAIFSNNLPKASLGLKTLSNSGCVTLICPIIVIHLFKMVFTQTEQAGLLSCRGL